jgi:hypothetical protein
MNKLGQIFSIEAIIVFLLVMIFVLNFPTISQKNYTDLITIQQQNDLLKIWSYNYPLSNEEFIYDGKKFFKEFQIKINDQIIFDELKSNNNNCISREEHMMDNFYNLQKIKITVCNLN